LRGASILQQFKESREG